MNNNTYKTTDMNLAVVLSLIFNKELPVAGVVFLSLITHQN